MLAGQPELHTNLDRPALAPLKQRIAFWGRLDRLKHEEIAAYIEYRLRVAGYRGPALFGPPVVGHRLLLRWCAQADQRSLSRRSRRGTPDRPTTGLAGYDRRDRPGSARRASVRLHAVRVHAVRAERARHTSAESRNSRARANQSRSTAGAIRWRAPQDADDDPASSTSKARPTERSGVVLGWPSWSCCASSPGLAG